jgi:hypothetical protein
VAARLLFDDVADLVDLGVELLLPIQQVPVGGLLEGSVNRPGWRRGS